MQNFFRMPTDNSGNVSTQHNKNNEIIVREEIIGELQAINQYQRHIDITNNDLVKKVLTDIKIEEEVHVGELFGLLFNIDTSSKTQFDIGLQEFNELKS